MDMRKCSRRWRLLWAAVFLFLSMGNTGCQEEELLVAEYEKEAPNEEVSVPEETAPPSPEPSVIYVDVAGAVNQPGVYGLPSDARLFQAIEAAGGFSGDAESSCVNQAMFLTDGEQIVVPTVEEAENWKQERVAVSAEGSQISGGDSRIDLNTADENELQTLSGIGQVKARAIIAYREANGPFQAVEEIMNVDGIGDGTFQKIKEDIIAG